MASGDGVGAGSTDAEQTVNSQGVSASDIKQTQKLEFSAVFSDVWFFPALFFTMFGGSLPIIALMHTVGVQHKFAAPIQAIIDAYHDGMTKFGAIVEPHLLPFVHWLGGLFGWHLHLYPHWRHVFVLTLIFPLAFVRQGLREQGDVRIGALVVSLYLPIVLVGAVISGLVDVGSGPWAQGLIACVPVVLILGASWWAETAMRLFHRGFRISSFGHPALKWAIIAGVAAFVIATVVAFLPGVGPKASLLVAGVGVVGWGALILHFGIRTRRAHSVRIGVMTLSGFVGTGLLFLADWFLKTYIHIA